MKPLEVKVTNLKKVDLKKEYDKAMKDPVFAKLTHRLKLGEEILCNYTSMIETSAEEYKKCMECSSLASCKNRIKGHVYIPQNIEGHLNFEYKSCKYFDKMRKNNKYLENVMYFNVPESLKDASISKIHKSDKNRFSVILWINNFFKEYKSGGKLHKGLYLHGNFGCGKTYMIVSLFNDLARDGYRSAVIFWPEFVRSPFDDDFKKIFEDMKRIPLLLIDDIGAEYNNSWSRDEILCPLLQYRMDEQLPTFFTSNFSIDQLEEHLANSKVGVESVKAARIKARIKQLSEELEMISKNLRN